MSYATMDHARWAAENIRLGKERTGKRRSDCRKGFAGAPDALSLFQQQVFDILGIAGGGIYNAPIAWDAIDWGFGHGFGVPWRDGRGLSTFDFQPLTTLVLLCHEARIRLEIRTHGPSFFLLVFSPREATGPMSSRHPSVEEAVALLRDQMPAAHRIFQPRPRLYDDNGRFLPKAAADA